MGNRRSKQFFKSKRFWSRFYWAAVFYVHSISSIREIASVDEICDYMRIVLISICEIQHVGSNCCLMCFSIKMLLACAGPRRLSDGRYLIGVANKSRRLWREVRLLIYGLSKIKAFLSVFAANI